MSKSLLHDWEYDIERCCRENLPCEMSEIAEDIYNTAYARGKNHSDATEVLDKLRAEIDEEYRDESEHPYGQGLRRALQIIDNYKAESENK